MKMAQSVGWASKKVAEMSGSRQDLDIKCLKCRLGLRIVCGRALMPLFDGW